MRNHDRPLWAMRPEALASVARVMSGELTGRFRERALELFGREPTAEELANSAQATTLEAADRRGELEVHNGVAVLRLTGMITPFGSLLSMLFGGGAGGLQGFREELNAAERDESVKAILIDVDSPGGLVDLVPETAADIRNVSKPTLAVANTEAASAAYWLASQADQLSVTTSGQVGSIGVFAQHDDISEMDKRMGIKTTLIRAGKHKAEGNPFEPLSDEARQAIQERVDKTYGMFIADVAKGRGTTASQVRSGFGEGRMELARDGVSKGMADRVETFDQAFQRLARAKPSQGAAAFSLTRSDAPAEALKEWADANLAGLEGEVEPAPAPQTDPAPEAEPQTTDPAPEPEPTPPAAEPEAPEPESDGESTEATEEPVSGSRKTEPLYGVPQSTVPAWQL